MKSKDAFLYRMLRPILTILFRMLYRPIYINKEEIPKEGRVILAGNHITNLDCIAVASATKRTVHYLGKIELFKASKLHAWFFQSVGVIAVDRSKKKNHQAMEEAEQVLNQNRVIGIFPEGTTLKEKGELLPFKLGAVALAQHTNSKIIPFVIRDSYHLFKKGLIIRFGQAMDVSEDTLEEANEKLRKEVLHLIALNEEK